VWSEFIKTVHGQVHPNMDSTHHGLSVINDQLTFALQRLMETGIQLSSHQRDRALEGDVSTSCAFFDLSLPDQPEGDELKVTFFKLPEGEDENLVETLEAQGALPGSIRLEPAVLGPADDGGVRRPLYLGSTRIMDTEALEAAVWLVLPGELGKHAVSEGNKALTKYRSSSDSPLAPLTTRSSLVFEPCLVGLIVNRCWNITLSTEASVYLAATLEYLAAEILELSGNACRDLREPSISPRHVMFAVYGDEELDGMFGMLANGAVKDGGTIPHIHKALIEKFDVGDEDEDQNIDEDGDDYDEDGNEVSGTGFSGLFLGLLGEHGVLIDPRDGNHKRVAVDHFQGRIQLLSIWKKCLYIIY